MAVARYFNDSFDTIENRCRIYKKAALTLVKDAEDTGRINQDMKKRTGAPKKTAVTKKGDPSTPDDCKHLITLLLHWLILMSI